MAELENTVRKILSAMPNAAENGAPWQFVKQVYAKRGSYVYRARPGNGGQSDVAVKLFTSDNDKKTSRRQYDALASCWQAGFQAVPRPLYYSDADAAMVMQWVDGHHLARSLFKASLFRRDASRFFMAAGDWLDAFHTINRAEEQPFDPSPVLKKVRRKLDGVRGTFQLKRLASISDRYEQLGRNLAGHPVEYVVLHGDFTPRNLFWSDGQAVGFDTLGSRRGVALEDICRFFMYVMVRAPLFRSPDAVGVFGESGDWQTFMEAYGNLVQDPDLVRFILLGEALCRWSALNTPGVEAGKFMVHSIENKRLQRLMYALL